MTEVEPLTASRRRFLERLLTAAVMAAAAPSVVLGRLVPSLRLTGGAVAGRFHIDLTDPKFSALVPIGGSMTLARMTGITFRVIVTRVDEATFIALNATCTHEGCTVSHVKPTSGGLLVCPCHSSRFHPDGTVSNGPAKEPLQRLATFFDGVSLVEIEIDGIAGLDDVLRDGVLVGDAVIDRPSEIVAVALTLEHPSDVRSTVHDAAGTRVADVAAGPLGSGDHVLSAPIDGLPAGAYFFRIETGRRAVIVRRFVVTR